MRLALHFKHGTCSWIFSHYTIKLYKCGYLAGVTVENTEYICNVLFMKSLQGCLNNKRCIKM